MCVFCYCIEPSVEYTYLTLYCTIGAGFEELVILGAADILGWGSWDVQCPHHATATNSLPLWIL